MANEFFIYFRNWEDENLWSLDADDRAAAIVEAKRVLRERNTNLEVLDECMVMEVADIEDITGFGAATFGEIDGFSGRFFLYHRDGDDENLCSLSATDCVSAVNEAKDSLREDGVDPAEMEDCMVMASRMA